MCLCSAQQSPGNKNSGSTIVKMYVLNYYSNKMHFSVIIVVIFKMIIVHFVQSVNAAVRPVNVSL